MRQTACRWIVCLGLVFCLTCQTTAQETDSPQEPASVSEPEPPEPKPTDHAPSDPGADEVSNADGNCVTGPCLSGGRIKGLIFGLHATLFCRHATEIVPPQDAAPGPYQPARFFPVPTRPVFEPRPLPPPEFAQVPHPATGNPYDAQGMEELPPGVQSVPESEPRNSARSSLRPPRLLPRPTPGNVSWVFHRRPPQPLYSNAWQRHGVAATPEVAGRPTVPLRLR
jgi:hypothetical protein